MKGLILGVVEDAPLVVKGGSGKVNANLTLAGGPVEAKDHKTDERHGGQGAKPQVVIGDRLDGPAGDAHDVGLDECLGNKGHEHAAQNGKNSHEQKREPFRAMNITLHVLGLRSNARELAHPFRVIHEGGSRSVGQKEQQNELMRVDEAHQGRPLRKKHAERRDEHDHDADEHQARKLGHAIEEKIHVLDVARGDMVLCGAHAQKQQALGDGVEDDKENRGPNGLGGADACARADETQVADGGISQHAFRVRLRDGHEAREHEGQAAHKDDEHRRSEAHRIDGRALKDKENTGLDHGGGMEQSRGGRWCHHRTQKPRVEGHLRCFGHARKSQTGKREHEKRRSVGTVNDELREVDDLIIHRQIDQSHLKCDTADHVHDDLPEGIDDGFVRLGEADEQKRAQGGDFPSSKQPCEIVEEHDSVHRPQENEHKGEEGMAAIRLAGIVIVVILHVAERIDDDSRTDNADDQNHDQRQRVEVQAPLAARQRSSQQLVREGQAKHHQGKQGSPKLAIFDGISQNHNTYQAIDAEGKVIDDLGAEIEIMPLGADVQGNENHRGDRDNAGGQADDNRARHLMPHYHQKSGYEHRKQNQESHELHAIYLFSRKYGQIATFSHLNKVRLICS